VTGAVSLSLSEGDLCAYTAAQLNTTCPDPHPVRPDDLRPAMPEALARLGHCFSHVDNKYFFDGQQSVFNHLHGDQYAMWLYFLSNTLYRQGGDAAVCAKLFLLNKALHGCDIFYEVALPDIFLLVHPLGTVLGRGAYSDYFVAYQRCGVGSNHDIYPTFGPHVTLRPGAAVLGQSTIGSHCQIAAETLVLDKTIEEGTVVMGPPNQLRRKPNTAPYPLWRVSR
jgi:serine O-acetyltransferase